jgi:hypothetical protein
LNLDLLPVWVIGIEQIIVLGRYDDTGNFKNRATSFGDPLITDDLREYPIFDAT